MDCPFCAEDIKDNAVFCRHCAHDLTLPKPLLEEVGRLSRKVEDLQDQLQKREDEINYLRPLIAPSPLGPRSLADRSAGALLGIVVTTIFITFGHYLLLYRLGATRATIQFSGLLISFFFGFYLYTRSSMGPGPSLVLGTILGLASFLSTSAIVLLIDGTPILPTTALAWQFSVEFVVAISLGSICGNAVASMFDGSDASPQDRPYSGVARRLLRLAGYDEGLDEFAKRLDRIEKVAKAVTAAIAALGALFVGVRGLIPHI